MDLFKMDLTGWFVIIFICTISSVGMFQNSYQFLKRRLVGRRGRTPDEQIIAYYELTDSEKRWRKCQQKWETWKMGQTYPQIDDHESQRLLLAAHAAFEKHLRIADKYNEAVYDRRRLEDFYDNSIVLFRKKLK